MLECQWIACTCSCLIDYPPVSCSKARWIFSVASVCLFVRMITSERLNVGWWNLGVRCIVQKSHPRSNVRVKGQGHRGQKKTKKMPSHPHWQMTVHGKATRALRTYTARSSRWLHCVATGGRGDGMTAVHVDGGLRVVFVGSSPRRAWLRRWENQRMLSRWVKVLRGCF